MIFLVISTTFLLSKTKLPNLITSPYLPTTLSAIVSYVSDSTIFYGKEDI